MNKWVGPFLLGLFGFIVLCGLGIWQIQRLAWKDSLIASLDARMSRDPVAILEINWLDKDVSGIPVEAKGQFAEGYLDVLSGGRAAEGAGYRRISPLIIGDERIMVELGFLPEREKDKGFVLPLGEVKIQGHIYAPKDGDGSYDAARNIWVGYDVTAMAQQLDTFPFILVASRSPAEGLQDTPMTIDLPNNHLQYAITWFLLASAWLIMSVYWGYRRTKEEG